MGSMAARPLSRRGPLAQRSARESARRRRELQDGEQAALVQRLPCCSCRRADFDLALARLAPAILTGAADLLPISEAHHEPTRAAGGTDRDTLPLCTECHRRRHDTGRRTFWGRAGVDPLVISDRIRAIVAEHGGRT